MMIDAVIGCWPRDQGGRLHMHRMFCTSKYRMEDGVQRTYGLSYHRRDWPSIGATDCSHLVVAFRALNFPLHDGGFHLDDARHGSLAQVC